MDIASPMATNATTIDTLHSCKPASVTVIAGDDGVRALEDKFRLYVVIESPDIPGNRVMARATAVFEVPIMRVDFQVTGNAFGFSIGEYLRSVAVVALRIAM